MGAVTAQRIKELRDRTGVGMGACKEALLETNGDMEEAITFLRKKGMASAVKKEGRATNEGTICTAESDKGIAVVEINAETDFVVKNDDFQKFAAQIAQEIADTNPDSLESFLQQKFSQDQALTVEEYRATIVQKIGENIQIKRFILFPKSDDKSIGVYSHMGGKIVVAVELTGASEEDLAKDIAMHAAAVAPDYLSPELVPQDALDHEREIAKSQIQGKPDNIVDKIVEGKINSYYKDHCLTEQPYVKDEKKAVKEIVAERAKETGKSLSILNFIRWSVGDK